MPAAPVADNNKPEAIASDAWTRLRDMVTARILADGCTDALYPGLRCYRFSRPVRYEKTQRLTPGVVVVLQGRKTAHLGGDGRLLDYGATQCLVLEAEVACLGTVVATNAGHPYFAIHLDLPPDMLVKSFVALAESGTLAEPTRVTENFTAAVGPEAVEAFVRMLLAATTRWIAAR